MAEWGWVLIIFGVLLAIVGVLLLRASRERL
jgi:hypothetical protein